MEFRWVVVLTLWTMLSGPVFNAAVTTAKPSQARARTATPVVHQR